MFVRSTYARLWNQTRDRTHGGARRTAPSPAYPERPFTTQADGGSLCPWTSALFPREFGFDTETSRCVFVSSRGGGVWWWGFLSNCSDTYTYTYTDTDTYTYTDADSGT